MDTTTERSPSWALDDVYIGEKCPNLCQGRGDCVGGVCYCDQGYIGERIMQPAGLLY